MVQIEELQDEMAMMKNEIHVRDEMMMALKQEQQKVNNDQQIMKEEIANLNTEMEDCKSYVTRNGEKMFIGKKSNIGL